MMRRRPNRILRVRYAGRLGINAMNQSAVWLETLNNLPSADLAHYQSRYTYYRIVGLSTTYFCPTTVVTSVDLSGPVQGTMGRLGHLTGYWNAANNATEFDTFEEFINNPNMKMTTFTPGRNNVRMWSPAYIATEVTSGGTQTISRVSKAPWLRIADAAVTHYLGADVWIDPTNAGVFTMPYSSMALGVIWRLYIQFKGERYVGLP